MSAQGYGHGSMGRKRKTMIVQPLHPKATRASVRLSWELGDQFTVITSDGPGKTITKAEAIAEGIVEVTCAFGLQRMDIRVKP